MICIKSRRHGSSNKSSDVQIVHISPWLTLENCSNILASPVTKHKFQTEVQNVEHKAPGARVCRV